MSDSTENILVIGATGMLGTEVARLLRSEGRQVVETVWPPDHDVQRICLDITEAEAVAHAIDWAKPKVIYNCSAFTDVDGAEENEELATDVNGRGVGYLARECRNREIMFVHVSTDYVFDGRGQRPYTPGDATDPQGAYGRSKLAGEKAIQYYLGESGRFSIVRTSWLFGSAGKNFIDTIVNLARQKPSLKVVHDQIGCPTYAPDLARCLVDIAQNDITGIYHFCNGPACSWFDFARKAVELAGLDCDISPCPTSEFPRPAPRPAYSVMDCSATFDKLGCTARSWQEALTEHLSQK